MHSTPSIAAATLARPIAQSYGLYVFGNAHNARLRQAFADQFEAEGTGVFYRKYMKGPAIRVTEAERDAFISTFQRRLRYALWGIVPATLLLIGLLVLLVPDVDTPMAKVAIYAGLATILIPFLAVYFWAWNAPARELARRTPTGGARTREEVRHIAFSKMTYGRLGSAFIMALSLVWNASAKNDVFHGWGILWLVFSGVLIVAVAIQAFRKWMYERR